MFYIVIIQSTGESLLFLAGPCWQTTAKQENVKKNSRQSDSFIVLKKLGDANGERELHNNGLCSDTSTVSDGGV